MENDENVTPQRQPQSSRILPLTKGFVNVDTLKTVLDKTAWSTFVSAIISVTLLYASFVAWYAGMMQRVQVPDYILVFLFIVSVVNCVLWIVANTSISMLTKMFMHAIDESMQTLGTELKKGTFHAEELEKWEEWECTDHVTGIVPETGHRVVVRKSKNESVKKKPSDVEQNESQSKPFQKKKKVNIVEEDDMKKETNIAEEDGLTPLQKEKKKKTSIVEENDLTPLQKEKEKIRRRSTIKK